MEAYMDPGIVMIEWVRSCKYIIDDLIVINNYCVLNDVVYNNLLNITINENIDFHSSGKFTI